MSEAQAQYAAGLFEEVEAFVAACLRYDGATTEDSVQAYRLQALAFLRLRDFDASTLEVLKLLGLSAAYEPDPIQDPPDYVGLVRFVKQQLQVPTPPAPPPAPALPIELVVQQPAVPLLLPPLVVPPALTYAVPAIPLPPVREAAERPISRIRLEGGLGLNHYAGERSDYEGGVYDDVFDNAGVGGQLGLTYELDVSFALGVLYEVGRYPTLLAPSDSSAVTEPLNEGRSSRWLHQLSAVFRTPFIGGSVRPYALAGATATLSHLNGALRVGGGPRVGIGVEGSLGRHATLFLETQGTLTFSGRVVDLAEQASYDPLSSLRVGVRYGL